MSVLVVVLAMVGVAIVLAVVWWVQHERAAAARDRAQLARIVAKLHTDPEGR